MLHLSSRKACSDKPSQLSHHPLDTSPVIPGAVEQYDLALGGQMRNVALEVPLAPLAFRGRAERHDLADARVEAFGNALDDAALARRVTPFEDNDDLEPFLLHPVLQLDKFELKPDELINVSQLVTFAFIFLLVLFELP